jgi:hypothetical protein
MEHAGEWARGPEPPTWLLLAQELAPIEPIEPIDSNDSNDSNDSSNYPYWLTIRRGKTRKRYPFSMTLVEYEKIILGTYPATDTIYRSLVVNRYYNIINYFNQLDFSNPVHIQNFEDWQTWWANSLDLIIPYADLVDEYNSIIFKGYDNMTIFDRMKLIELRHKIEALGGNNESPNPNRYDEPIMLDLDSEPRAIPFIPYVWDLNLESYSDYYKRLNSIGGNKYKRTKKYRKFKKYRKSKKPKKYKKSKKSRKSRKSRKF